VSRSRQLVHGNAHLPDQLAQLSPLGYRAQDRKLIIIDSEAEIVRFIFRRHAELGSVRLLKDELDARSIQSKSRTSASGRISGGKPFARGALYLMLQNRIYLGEIVHNQQSYAGEHQPIRRSAAMGCSPGAACGQCRRA
jgi:hypothetical protein